MPEADRIETALPALNDATVGTALLLVVLDDEAVELLDPLGLALAEVFEVGAGDAGGGSKVSFPLPKPIAAGSLPPPPMMTGSF